MILMLPLALTAYNNNCMCDVFRRLSSHTPHIPIQQTEDQRRHLKLSSIFQPITIEFPVRAILRCNEMHIWCFRLRPIQWWISSLSGVFSWRQMGHAPFGKTNISFGFRIKIGKPGLAPTPLSPCVGFSVQRKFAPSWNPKYATGFTLQ